jgi:hypothetical protein
MKYVHYKIQVRAFQLYLTVLSFIFVDMVFEVLNSDRLLLILSMLCLLLSIIFCPIEKIKNKREFLLFPLMAGLLFEGIFVSNAFLSDTFILSEKIINVNIILSGYSVWIYYQLNIKKKEHFSF